MLNDFQEITSEQEWEQLVTSFTEANFLQSFYWGEFENKLNKKVFRFVLKKGNQPEIIFQAIKEEAKRGNYLTIAGGPLLDWDKLDKKLLKQLVDFLKQLAQQEHCIFVRFRPQAIDSIELRKKT